MPDISTIGGGPSETGSVPASTAGINLTANASINTKATAYTEVIAATDYAADWLLITLARGTTFTAGFLVDVAVGGATAEQVLIANLFFQEHNATARTYLFPVRVPAGTRLSARCQSTVASNTMQITVTAIASGIAAPPGLGRVETIGADTTDSGGTAVDCGATAHTDVVSQLAAATGFAYRWMCLGLGNNADAAITASQNLLVDVCTGAGGSEVPVVSDLLFSGGSANDSMQPGGVCFPCAIAAGARVAIRARCSITTAGDRVQDFVAYGVG